jgi:preprotein translocase subunit SecF
VSTPTDTATDAGADSLVGRLTTGRAEFDFVGRSRTWLLLIGAIMLLSLLALGLRGLDFSIEFTGGSAFTVVDAEQELAVADIEDALGGLGLTDTIVQVVDDGAGAQISTEALSEVEAVSEGEVIRALEELSGGEVSASTIGPRWGAQVTRQAVRGLVVFLLLVVLYLTLRFEWRMALAAIVAMVHDVVISVGIYSLFGFVVTPATVIAFLTILGYSLYDTVVVFDRIDEETEGLTASTANRSYGEVANGALNHVLLRSISTAITSILPVAVLVLIGFAITSVATLLDLSLALLIGMVLGIYSSIVVATPLLVWLKEKQPHFAELKQRRAAAR